MTLGITPDSPATGYGYIRPGLPVEGGQGATQVERFVEKPDAATAARYVAEGYLWNSGNFLFQAGVMREELEAFAPEVLAAARAALDGAVRDLDFIRLAPEAFQKAPKISIDYAVMERTEARRRAAGLLRLVGCRHLGHGVGGQRAGRAGQCRARPGQAGRHPQQPRPQRRPDHRRGRARRHHRRRQPRRRARHQPRQGRAT